MPLMPRHLCRAFRRRLIVGLCALTASSIALGADGERHEVRDLEFGHGLFHFYQGHYFDAATHLLVARQQARLEHHRDDADLLLGGIYLSYGQQREARSVFDRLLNQDVAPAVRDQAWLYAAQIAYQRGDRDSAVEALTRIGASLEPGPEAQRRLLRARIHVEQGAAADAVALLDRWRAPDGWRAFTRYNLGVALIQNGDPARGTSLLTKAAGGAPQESAGTVWWAPWRWFGSSAEDRYDEGQALQDKIYLALGYAHLKEGNPEPALTWLDQIGDGMWATRAYLGVGWAAAELEDYPRAISAWERLTGGDPLDAAVQESRLGLPFAHAKLGDEARAAAGYRDAISVFRDEIERLHALGERLRNDAFLESLLLGDSGQRIGWFWSLDDVTSDDRSRYLYRLMADHEFQEGLKNYRDLLAMRRNLDRWSDGVEAFDLMLSTRRELYAQHDTALGKDDSTSRLAEIEARVSEQRRRLDAIEQTQDARALTTPDEDRVLQRIERIERTLLAVDGQPAFTLQRKKLALLKGSLIWRLDTQYAARLWQHQKALKAVDASLAKAQQRRARLSVHRREAPAGFEAFQARIDDAGPRVAALTARVDVALDQHERFLKALAIARFDEHADRLRAYLTEAQFALANTYDRLAETEAASR
ncbi:MAG: hypothetical protein AAF610_07865 [Pseudomonadota bacterium]